MTETLELDIGEQVRSMASIVARHLGNCKSLPKTECGYEAHFENKDFTIDDRCSGNGDCNKGSETKIMFHGKLVYHQRAGKVKAYNYGPWEESLKKLETQVRQY